MFSPKPLTQIASVAIVSPPMAMISAGWMYVWVYTLKCETIKEKEIAHLKEIE